MKKLVLTLTAAASLFAFSACKPDSTSTTPAKTDQAAAAPAKRAAVPVLSLVSADAGLVIYVHDVPSIREKLKDTAWNKMWNDEKFIRFFAPQREKMKVDEWDENVKAETGLSLEDLYSLIQGDVMLAAPDLAGLIESIKRREATEASLLLVAELGDNTSKMEQLIGKVLEKNAEVVSKHGGVQTETYAGTTINYIDGYEDGSVPCWCIHEGVLMAGVSKRSLMVALDAYAGGGVSNGFANSARYLKMKQETGDAQVFCAIDVRQMMPVINSSLDEKSSQGVSYIDYSKLSSGLGLSSLTDVYFGISCDDTEFLTRGAVCYTEQTGLLKLLGNMDGMAVIPPYISSSWPTYGTGKYDIPAAFGVLEDVLSTISPGGRNVVEGVMTQAKANFGIDIRRDLIGSMGDEIQSMEVLPPGVTLDDPNLAENLGQIVIISLRDSRTFENALETFKRASQLENHPAFTKRDYLGTTLYCLDLAQAGSKSVSYAIVQNHFVLGLGAPEAMEPVLQAIIKGVSDPLQDQPGVQRLYSDLPPNTYMLNIQDTSFAFRTLCTTIGMVPQMRELFDEDAMPTAADFAKYWGTAYAWYTKKSDGVYFTSKVEFKK